MSEQPIFIVGVPRSGTTLLAASLAAHSRLSCGPETHFFRRLVDTDSRRLCDSANWPGNAVDFLAAIKHSGFGEHTSRYLLEKYELSISDITTYLEQREPYVSSILASVTEQYMLRLNKQRWAEKTPDHLVFGQQIREFFPGSAIVRIIRDPRDVAMSLQNVPWGAKSFWEALLYWRSQDDKSRDFFLSDHNCYTLRFEDLVSDPADTLGKLCQFLDEAFEEEMLDTSNSGRQVNSRYVPWKKQASQPFNTDRTYVWRNELSASKKTMAEALLGDRLVAYGYPTEGDIGPLGEFYPNEALAAKYEDAVASVITNGVRFWKKDSAEEPSVKIFLGDPAKNEWLQTQKRKNLKEMLSLSTGIVGSRLGDDTIYWIPDEEEDWSGYYAFLLKKLLSPHRYQAPETRSRPDH